jgi:hypothetical protein
MEFTVAPGQDGEFCSLYLQYRVCAFVPLCVHMSKNLKEIISFGVCTVINLTCAHTHVHEEIHILDQTFITYGPRAACGSLVLTVTTLRNNIDFFDIVIFSS